MPSSVGGHLERVGLAITPADVQNDVVLVLDVLNAVLGVAPADDVCRDQLQVRVPLGQFEDVPGVGLGVIPVLFVLLESLHDVGDDGHVHVDSGLSEREELLARDVHWRPPEVVLEPDEPVLLDGAAELLDGVLAESGVDPCPPVEEIRVFLDVLRDGAVRPATLRDGVADLADEGDSVDAHPVCFGANLVCSLRSLFRRRIVLRPDVEVTVDHDG